VTRNGSCNKYHPAWSSAFRGKWGQLTPLEKWMKNQKAKTCKKEQFSEWEVGV